MKKNMQILLLLSLCISTHISIQPIENTEKIINNNSENNSETTCANSTKNDAIIDDIFTLDEQTYQKERDRKPATGIRKFFKQIFEKVGLSIATAFITLRNNIKK